MKIKKAQIPLITVVVGLIGVGIYGFVSQDIKGNKLVKQCNDGKTESCDEVPKNKYELLTNEKWINDNRHGKTKDLRLKKNEEFYKDTIPKPKPKKIDKFDLVRLCERSLKANLKDPDSYRRLNSRDNQIATGLLRYSATNSYGG